MSDTELGLGVVQVRVQILVLWRSLQVVSWILTIWFCGSFLIFFLARALGGEVGYSQCLGVIGYCLIPLVVTGFILPIISKWHYLALSVKVSFVE